MTVTTLLRIAVLIDTYNGPTIPFIKKGFTDAIHSASPSAQVDFYDPIEAQVYPDPTLYDLIVLSGGTEDMTVSNPLPWVVKLKEFLKNTAESFPNKKMMGICWGHQTICVAFGGVVKSEALDKAEVRGSHTCMLTFQLLTSELARHYHYSPYACWKVFFQSLRAEYPRIP